MKTGKRPAPAAHESRRRFTKAFAAAVVAAPVVAMSDAKAQTPPGATKQSPAPPNPQPSPTPAPQKPSPVAEAYTEIVRLRFGDQLKPADLDAIKRDFDGYTRTTERLRAYKLKNGDEPDFIFGA